MRILLDESVPVQVRLAMTAHDVSAVSGLGWKGLENGDLLAAAERAGFEVLVLADKNLRYQQNLTARRIALVELWTNHRPTLERHFPYIAVRVVGAAPWEHMSSWRHLNRSEGGAEKYQIGFSSLAPHAHHS